MEDCFFGVEGGLVIEMLLIILAVAAWTDLKEERIPNYLIVIGFLAGIFYRLSQGTGMLSEGLLGGIVPLFLFVPLFLIRAMGAGDIKLMSVMGIFLGVRSVLYAIVVAICFAAVFGVIRGIYRHTVLDRIKYLFAYFERLFVYAKTPGEDIPIYTIGQTVEEGRIHFAIALLAGGIVMMGGII